MVAESSGTRLIRVKIEAKNNGLYVATSPTIKGLFVSTSYPERMDSAIKQAIVDLYAACGERVIVSKADDGDGEDSTPWVAIRADLAAAELALAR